MKSPSTIVPFRKNTVYSYDETPPEGFKRYRVQEVSFPALEFELLVLKPLDHPHGKDEYVFIPLDDLKGVSFREGMVLDIQIDRAAAPTWIPFVNEEAHDVKAFKIVRLGPRPSVPNAP